MSKKIGIQDSYKVQEGFSLVSRNKEVNLYF